MSSDESRHGRGAERRIGVASAVILSAAMASCVVAGVAGAQAAPGDVASTPFSPGKVFTFLFLTLGPFKIIGPFAEMTHGRDAAFKRELALRATLFAAIGLVAAATIGASTLQKWGVSVGALELTAGIILFLVALRPVLAQYEPREAPGPVPAPGTAPAEVSASKLAIAPLAFPTIVTPWGVAVLIMLATLRADYWPIIAGVTALVLAVNLVAMLSAERILRTPFVGTVLAIVGMVLGILQVALGVQAAVAGLQLLGIVGPGSGYGA